jgi:hypothetical protein
MFIFRASPLGCSGGQLSFFVGQTKTPVPKELTNHMPETTPDDPFASIRAAKTNGANYDLDTDDIISRLEKWKSLCNFRVTGAGFDTVDIEFDTLPEDMDAFSRDMYEFCPDLVDQGTGCLHEMIELAEETGEDLDPKMQELIKGVDFEDEDYGVEILKREIQRDKRVKLWWDLIRWPTKRRSEQPPRAVSLSGPGDLSVGLVSNGRFRAAVAGLVVR